MAVVEVALSVQSPSAAGDGGAQEQAHLEGFWVVRVLKNVLGVRLITPTAGKDRVLRDLRFPIKG